jgi:hypothetical protein
MYRYKNKLKIRHSKNESIIMNTVFYKLIDSIYKLIDHIFYENRNPTSLSRPIFKVIMYFSTVKYICLPAVGYSLCRIVSVPCGRLEQQDVKDVLLGHPCVDFCEICASCLSARSLDRSVALDLKILLTSFWYSIIIIILTPLLLFRFILRLASPAGDFLSSPAGVPHWSNK